MLLLLGYAHECPAYDHSEGAVVHFKGQEIA
jgi:hypothetical protein